MFGKVLKYEMRATGLLYGVTLGIGVLFGLLTLFTTVPLETTGFHYIMNDAKVGMAVVVSLCTMVGVLIPVLFFVLTAIRYTQSMYGREGYLSHSLPVSPTSLVLGKFVSTMIWGLVFSFLCAFLFFSILYSILMPEYMLASEMSGREAMAALWSDIGKILSDVGELVILLSLSIVLNIMLYSSYIFLAVTLAHLPCFSKGHTALAVVFFFVIIYVEGSITEKIVQPSDVVYLVLAVLHIVLVIWLVKKHTALQ